MVPLVSLWLPILVSAVLVFIASSLIHMFLNYHANDYGKLPDEDAVGTAMRNTGVDPGHYVIPYASSMKEMGTPEFVEKQKRGPVAMITVRPSGPARMGAQLTWWFVFNVVVSIFAGYVAGRAVGAGADYLSVFRFAGVTAFAAYGLGTWSETIWYGRSLSTTLKNTLDAAIYAVVTAGAFGWLWPGM